MGVMDIADREKMVIGLRLEYLSRSAEVREDVRSRLSSVDPFVIADSISVPDPSGSGTIDFKVFSDTRDVFAENLQKLLGGTAGEEYIVDQNSIVPYNSDHTGNRDRIKNWWQGLSAPAFVRIRDELTDALDKALKRNLPIRIFWCCELSFGSEPTIVYREENFRGNLKTGGHPTILFFTDKKPANEGGPISDPSLADQIDGPEDPVPVFQGPSPS